MQICVQGLFDINIFIIFIPCFYDTCNIQDLIIGIIIPSSISLPTLPFTHFRDIPSLDVISTSGPRVPFGHTEEQIPLLMHTSQPTLLEYLKSYHNMNIMIRSYYDSNIGYVHHGIYRMTWSHCQLNINVPWSGNLDHQLTNELVLEVY
jgi:hypothetical protein